MAQNKKITCFVRETFSFLTRVAGKGGVSQVRYCYINLYEYSICAFHLLKCVAPNQHFYHNYVAHKQHWKSRLSAAKVDKRPVCGKDKTLAYFFSNFCPTNPSPDSPVIRSKCFMTGGVGWRS